MTYTNRIRGFWQALERRDLADLLTRLGLMLAATALISSALSNWSRFPIASERIGFLLVASSFPLGFTLITLSLLTRVRVAKFAFLIPAAAVFTAASNYWIFVFWVPGYGTDALAFLHYSAILTLQGRNPFQESMLPSLKLFGTSPFIVSPLETGQALDRTPYPALAFLIYVPAIAAGLGDIRPVSLAFHVMAILILYRRVKGPMRFLAPLTLVFTQDWLDFTPGGVTDVIWVVPAILMALDLRKVNRAAIWFGLACSIKLTPIFLGPFLIVWYYRSSATAPGKSGLRNALTFLAISSSVFLAINAPFIIPSPGSWVAAVTAPLGAPVVLYGTGFSGLGFFGFSPLPRMSYVLITAVVFSVLLCALLFRFERYRYALWFFPAVVLYFTPRSLHNYYIYLYPLAFLALGDWMHELRKGRV